MCLLAICISSLEKCLFRPSTLSLIVFFFFLLLSCMSCLYILEIKPFLVATFAKQFSQFVCCLFILFMVSFAVQELICFIRSHFLIFVLISITLGDWPKKTLVRFMSENVLPMISSRSFMMSCIMLKFLSHFAFIFLYGERMCSNSFDVLTSLHMAVQLSQHYLLNRWYFSHCIFSPPLSKINWP